MLYIENLCEFLAQVMIRGEGGIFWPQNKEYSRTTSRFVKKHKISNPIMYHLGVRIGPVLWFKRRKIKKLGIMMAENPAGAEWRRTKWGKLLQAYLYISAVMMAKSTDCMICDNELNGVS